MGPLPPWLDRGRLLGPGEWSAEGTRFSAELSVREAADLAARLRGMGLAGQPVEVAVSPPLPRAAVRAARVDDARRRRDTTPGFLRPGARMDDEGRVSLTPEPLACAFAAGTAGKSVVDAGCGVGGNAIAFARAGARVTAIERDAERLNMARSNAALYGVADRIRFVHGDALALIQGLTGDLLFCDPPWGVAWDRVRTGLGSLPFLAALLPLARGRFSAICAKAPPSFDPAAWPEATPEAVFGLAAGDRRRIKFLLLRDDRFAQRGT